MKVRYLKEEKYLNTIKGLYIHFPFCVKKCNYCDFHSGVLNPNSLKCYQTNLLWQFDEVQKINEKNNAQFGALDTIYIGGGTPSLWGEEGRKFLEHLLRQFKLSSNLEFTIEMNPNSASLSEVKKWMEIGVNRFSIGVQALDDGLLKNLDRIHSSNEALSFLNELGMMNVNFSADLMMGLPDSPNRNLLGEAQKFVDAGAKHISAYILTVDDNYIYYDKLPSENQIEDEYLSLAEFLISNDYNHYEVANFAKDKWQSKHNLMYWNSESVAALGPSATGLIADTNQFFRYKWDLQDITYQSEILTGASLDIEKFYMAFRSSIGIELSFFSNDLGNKILDNWCKQDLVIMRGNRVTLSSKGYLIVDSLMDQLFINNLL